MKTIVLSVASTLLLLSCSNDSHKLQNELNAEADIKKQTIQEPSAQQAAALTDTTMLPATANTDILQAGQPDWDKKLIKTANLILELDNYNAFNSSIHAKLKSFGAYTAQENQTETTERIENNLTIKVPVDKFEDLLNSIQGDGIKILDKNISTEDVTGEIVDTRARLEAKKQVRLRYMELLGQAKNMTDILQVQNEINSIQEEIESADGRVNYLTHQSVYSTISIKYFQYLNGVTAKDVTPGFFKKLTQAFYGGASFLGNIMLFIVWLWPLILGGVVIYILFRKMNFKKVRA